MVSSKPTLQDLLKTGLDLVICGKAAGNRSAQEGVYFANPTNRFWPTLEAVGLTPQRLRPHEYRKLIEYGIGLTDLAKYASGPDSGLREADYDIAGFRDRMKEVQPRVAALMGKAAATRVLGLRKIDYDRQDQTVGATILFAVPDTSVRLERPLGEGPPPVPLAGKHWQRLFEHSAEFLGNAGGIRYPGWVGREANLSSMFNASRAPVVVCGLPRT